MRRAAPLVAFLLVYVVLVLMHLPLLTLPFFWDELGYFIPAALDLWQHGQWVPVSTLANVHPPGIPAYLCAVWTVTGYSIASSRLAMLAWGAALLGGTGLLARRLHPERPEACAGIAMLLLAVSPLFYMQSMMAQLDLPAATLTVLGLLLFLQSRWLASAAVCAALVLVKETGIVLPALLCLSLLMQRRFRPAAWYLSAPVALLLWLLLLRSHTGHLLGNAEFATYNVSYSLHPLRSVLAVARRLYTLFVDQFHWIGSLVLWRSWRVTAWPAEWRLVAVFIILHTLLVSVLGGAVLERYLLPVLPLVYIAFARGLLALPKRTRQWATAALATGLLLCLWLSPPYPFALENNLAMVDFVRLQQQAAAELEEQPGALVATAWPLTDALRRPELGYVSQPMPVQALANFGPALQPELNLPPSARLVTYTLVWNAPPNLLSRPAIREFLQKYYGYDAPISPQQMKQRGFVLAREWQRRGQVLRIYMAEHARRAAP